VTHSKKLVIKRTVTQTYEVTWPDDYPGMTLKEAIEYERDMKVDQALELISMDDYQDGPGLTVESEIQGIDDA
jgi:hypothetical protein